MTRTAVIDVQKMAKDLKRIVASVGKLEEVTTIRTLNTIATRSRTMIANDVKDDTGISVGTARRRISIYKAKEGKLQATLFIKAARVTYPSPRKLKMGVSFIGSGKVRKKVTTKIQRKDGTGSRPFIIRGRHSGKKVPVYVIPNAIDEKTSKRRKVAAMYFSSLPHVARKDWQEKVNAFSISEFKKEYPKQLKRARRSGRY